MEHLVDLPLQEVRIFRNRPAERVTRALDADAVTVGADIYVAPGQGNTGTPSGQALIAHELSHVAGQAADAPLPAVAEEQRALRLEHAVQRRELAAPGRSGVTSEVPWALPEGAEALLAGDGRNGPPRHLNSAAPGATGGGGRSSGGVPALVARAPENRPSATEPASAAAGANGERSGPEENHNRRSEEDEAGLIERVVDRVLHRLRREASLERERTGSVLLPRMKWE